MEIFNLLLKTDTFPDIMKIARICPIFKSGDKELIVNYRPISVVPAFSKISERLLYSRLFAFLNLHALLTPSQLEFHYKYSS